MRQRKFQLVYAPVSRPKYECPECGTNTKSHEDLLACEEKCWFEKNSRE